MQSECDMVPLMMEEKYKPKGWRKSQHQVLRLVVPYCCHDMSPCAQWV